VRGGRACIKHVTKQVAEEGETRVKIGAGRNNDRHWSWGGREEPSETRNKEKVCRKKLDCVIMQCEHVCHSDLLRACMHAFVEVRREIEGGGGGGGGEKEQEDEEGGVR
jgi:hypothetical protein